MLERYIIGQVVEPWVNAKSRICFLKTAGTGSSGQKGSQTASSRAELQLRPDFGSPTTRQELLQFQLATAEEEQKRRACLRRNSLLGAQTQQAKARDH